MQAFYGCLRHVSSLPADRGRQKLQCLDFILFFILGGMHAIMEVQSPEIKSFFFFFLFQPPPTAYGSSWARDLDLGPTTQLQQHQILNPLSHNRNSSSPLLNTLLFSLTKIILNIICYSKKIFSKNTEFIKLWPWLFNTSGL